MADRRDEEQDGEGETADATHHGGRQRRRRHGAADVVAEGESDASGNDGGDAFHKGALLQYALDCEKSESTLCLGC